MKPTDVKLTLKLKQASIKKAKAYAKSHQESLSRLVERYFDSVSEPPATYEAGITPLVKELSGVAPLKKGADEKKLYSDYLAGKYSK
jgi:threonine synthase